jgi:hypothetical protein
MHRRGLGAAGLIGFYQTLRCVFYGFTVRLVGAPFFFAGKKEPTNRHHAIHSYRISIFGQC